MWVLATTGKLKKTSEKGDSHLPPKCRGSCAHHSATARPAQFFCSLSAVTHCRKWKIKFCFHNILASAFPQQHRFFFFLLHFLSHPILHLPHPPARFWRFLSRRQALYSAEHPPGSTGLLALNSRMLCGRTVKSGSTCFLLPFTAYVLPSHNFNMLFLTFFTSFSNFLFLLPFTALCFLSSFFPFPNSLSQLPLRKINTP